MTSYTNSRGGDHGQLHTKLLEDEGWSRWSWVRPKASPLGLNWLPRAAAASATNSMAQNHSNTLSHTSGGWTSKTKLQQGLPASDSWGKGSLFASFSLWCFTENPWIPWLVGTALPSASQSHGFSSCDSVFVSSCKGTMVYWVRNPP